MLKLRARMADMGTACYVCAWPVLKRRVGVRGSVEVRRLANLVTLRDDREVFFVAASGQIQMAANTRPAPLMPSSPLAGRSGRASHYSP
jgi:hypothetical protein